jgi:DNA-binding MarR family transcriptional regulator
MTTPGGDPIARLDVELAFLVRRLEMNHRKRGYPMERAHYLLLAQLKDGEKSTGEIAAALGLDHSTVVRQLATVERLGFTERRPNPRDGRSVLVAVTAHGAASIAKMRDERRARLGQILADWSDAEREGLSFMIGRLNAALLADDERETARAE